MTQAYPLHWPEGWPRTTSRARSRFDTSVAKAIAAVEREVSLLGGKATIISSNVNLTDRNPKDPGIAIYFTKDGRQLCVPCDRWDCVEDNIQAIAKTIEALRGIERWGAKHMVDAAFRGFTALPPPGAPWRVILDNPKTLAEAEANYRRCARENHPDNGGNADAMVKLNAAIQQARKELSA